MGPWTLYSTKPHIKKATEGHLFIKATGSFLYTLHAYWKGCSTDADGSYFIFQFQNKILPDVVLYFFLFTGEWCGSIAWLTRMFRDVSMKNRNPRKQALTTYYTMC